MYIYLHSIIWNNCKTSSWHNRSTQEVEKVYCVSTHSIVIYIRQEEMYVHMTAIRTVFTNKRGETVTQG